MLAILAQIFIGSSPLFSLTIALLGIYKQRPYFLLISSLCSLGFAWYLTGSPSLFMHITSYLLPLLHIFALAFLQVNKKWSYFLVISPYAIFFLSSLITTAA